MQVDLPVDSNELATIDKINKLDLQGLFYNSKEGVRYVQKGHPILVTQVALILKSR